jgi:hypothetical protein
MIEPSFLASKFAQALSYDPYVGSGKPDHQKAWQAFRERSDLTTDQQALVGSFSRRLPVLVVSGTWCGDCVQQIPFIDAIDRAGPTIEARYLDRDLHPDLSSRLMLCGGLRVPVVLILNEDFDILSVEGDRTLARYRAIAARQLGPSCPLPGAPVPDDEVAATRQDWVDAFERAHLMARLSTKLRARHAD